MVQGFVRSLVIVASQPAGEAMLLASTGVGGGLSRFSFHHPVKLFVGAIVLWTSWPCKFHPDAQTYPPCAQLRKARWSSRSEGAAVVDPNHLRPAITSKKPRKSSFDRRAMLAGQHLRQQTITTEQIAHGQGLATLALARPEPPFEIHRPNMVGSSCPRPSGMETNTGFARPTGQGAGQLQTCKPAANGSRTGWMPPLPLKPCPHLLRAPRRVTASQLPYALHPSRRQLSGHMARTPAAILQRRMPPFGHKARFPFICGFAADTKMSAPISYRLFVPEQRLDQTTPLPNWSLYLPRHDPRNPLFLSKICHPCLVPKVSPMCCPRAVMSLIESESYAPKVSTKHAGSRNPFASVAVLA